MIGTLAGILATAAMSHLGGAAVGGVLARFGLLGFGRKLAIARHVLKVGRALRKSFQVDPTEQARRDLLDWLKQHDPDNTSGLGDGVPPPSRGKSTSRKVKKSPSRPRRTPVVSARPAAKPLKSDSRSTAT